MEVRGARGARGARHGGLDGASLLARAPVRGVALRRVPRWREPRAVKLLGAVWDGMTLLVRSPRRARRLLREVRRPAPGRSGRRRGLRRSRSLRSYLRLARLRPDVVHFEWGTAAVHHLPLFAVWRCPVVVSRHGDVNVDARPPGNERWARGLPVAFRRASAVHCVSEATLAEARPTAWTARPASSAPGSTRSFHPPARRAALVGAADRERGAPVLGEGVRVRAAGAPAPHRRGRPGGARHRGEGEERAHWSATIEDLGLGDRVRLSGALTSLEVRARLHRADVFLQASVSEGTAVSALEAMACGLPVVATDCGGRVRASLRSAGRGAGRHHQPRPRHGPRAARRRRSGR